MDKSADWSEHKPFEARKEKATNRSAVGPIASHAARNRWQRWRVMWHLAKNYIYDYRRYLTWSSVDEAKLSQEQLHAIITKDYHRIEKGLALPEPRPGFGKDVIGRLDYYLPRYLSHYGRDDLVDICQQALAEYVKHAQAHGAEVETAQSLLDGLRRAALNAPGDSPGGTMTVTRASIHEVAKLDLSSFFATRYSVRQFAPGDVPDALIEQAVRMAQKTPSVCNRQSCRVYAYSDEAGREMALRLQNGNRGFGHQASQVLVVTSDLQNFTDIGERYQGWIDGGMFAMSLVYALHALGLGTCTLNWSAPLHRDLHFRKITGIPESELVIMLIAVGHLPDRFPVAQSPRRPIEDVLIRRPSDPKSLPK